jgi:hypothetical protein
VSEIAAEEWCIAARREEESRGCDTGTGAVKIISPTAAVGCRAQEAWQEWRILAHLTITGLDQHSFEMGDELTMEGPSWVSN